MSAALDEAGLGVFQSLAGPWNRACIDRDWDALLELCTDDVVFMPPGESSVSGKGLRAWLDASPPIKSMNWEIENADMAGELAVLRGPLTQALEMDGAIVDVRIKYCDVLRRGKDGKWRFACVIWNET